MKGGSEPLMLDLCLADVISKYFSKLRFCTNKFQPELKYLENILRVFMNPFLQSGTADYSRFVEVFFKFSLFSTAMVIPLNPEGMGIGNDSFSF